MPTSLASAFPRLGLANRVRASLLAAAAGLSRAIAGIAALRNTATRRPAEPATACPPPAQHRGGACDARALDEPIAVEPSDAAVLDSDTRAATHEFNEQNSADSQPVSSDARECVDCAALAWDWNHVPLIPELAGMPIAPLGKRRANRAADGTLSFASLDWKILLPTAGNEQDVVPPVPTNSSVLMVLFAVLRQYALAGFPSSGEVEGRVSRMMADLGHGADETGGHPSGAQYQQLRGALDYLEQVRYSNSTDSQLGRVFAEADMSSRCSETGRRTRASHWRVRLAPEIVISLRAAYVDVERTIPTAEHDRVGEQGHRHRSLTSRVPVLDWEFARELHRTGGDALALYHVLVAQSATEKRIAFEEHHFAVETAKLYARLGGGAEWIAPSTLGGALADAHAALVRAGVIAAPPESHGRGARRTYRYTLMPPGLTGLSRLLYWQAVDYGVGPRVAASYACDPVRRPLLMQVLAAVTLGMLDEPREDLGRQIIGLVNRLQRDGGAIDDLGYRFLRTRGAHRPARRGAYLDRLGSLVVPRWTAAGRLPAWKFTELRRHCGSATSQAEWVTDGLFSIHLNRMFGILLSRTDGQGMKAAS
jgi:hypothetical protein